VSSLYSVAFVRFSSIFVPAFFVRKETGINWRTVSFLFFSLPRLNVASTRLTPHPANSPVAGRLHASIDKVHGIVETTHPSLKNAQYETVVKQGDVLLNEVQRLSKVLYQGFFFFVLF
jgi:hypothetical protein